MSDQHKDYPSVLSDLADLLEQALRAHLAPECARSVAEAQAEAVRRLSESAGKAYKSLYNKLTAYRVASVSHVGNDQARDSWRNLAEIHGGGGLIYIPQGARFNRQQRNEAIMREFDGRNHAALARRYRVSVSSVYGIVARARHGRPE